MYIYIYITLLIFKRHLGVHNGGRPVLFVGVWSEIINMKIPMDIFSCTTNIGIDIRCMYIYIYVYVPWLLIFKQPSSQIWTWSCANFAHQLDSLKVPDANVKARSCHRMFGTRNIQRNHGETMGKPWENPLFMVILWETHGKTMEKWWLKGNLWDLPSGKRLQ